MPPKRKIKRIIIKKKVPKQKQKQKQSQNINIHIDQSKKTNPRPPSQPKQPAYAGPSIHYIPTPIQQQQPIQQPQQQPNPPNNNYSDFNKVLSEGLTNLNNKINSFQEETNDFMSRALKPKQETTNDFDSVLSSNYSSNYSTPVQTPKRDKVIIIDEGKNNISQKPLTLFQPQTPQTPENPIIRTAKQTQKTKQKEPPLTLEFKPRTIYNEFLPKLNVPSSIPKSFFDNTPYTPESNNILLAIEDKKPEPEENKINTYLKEQEQMRQEQEQMGQEEEQMGQEEKYKLLHYCPFCSESKHFANLGSLISHMRSSHKLSTTIQRNIKDDGNGNPYRLGKKENGIQPINYLYDDNTIENEIKLRRELTNKMSTVESTAIARESKQIKSTKKSTK